MKQWALKKIFNGCPLRIFMPGLSPLCHLQDCPQPPPPPSCCPHSLPLREYLHRSGAVHTRAGFWTRPRPNGPTSKAPKILSLGDLWSALLLSQSAWALGTTQIYALCVYPMRVPQGTARGPPPANV